MNYPSQSIRLANFHRHKLRHLGLSRNGPAAVYAMLAYCIESSRFARLPPLKSCPTTHAKKGQPERPLVAIGAISWVAATQVCWPSPGETYGRVAIIGVIPSEFGNRDALQKMRRKGSGHERLRVEVILTCHPDRATVNRRAVWEIATWRHVRCDTGGRL